MGLQEGKFLRIGKGNTIFLMFGPTLRLLITLHLLPCVGTDSERWASAGEFGWRHETGLGGSKLNHATWSLQSDLLLHKQMSKCQHPESDHSERLGSRLPASQGRHRGSDRRSPVGSRRDSVGPAATCSIFFWLPLSSVPASWQVSSFTWVF
jgi:hypothetical protein